MTRPEKIQYLKDIKNGKQPIKNFDWSLVSLKDLEKCINLKWEAIGVGDFESIPWVSGTERDRLWDELPQKDKDRVTKEQENILSKYL